VEGALLEEVGGVEVFNIERLHTDLLADLPHQTILQTFAELQSATGELGDPLAPDEFIGYKDVGLGTLTTVMQQQPIGAKCEVAFSHFRSGKLSVTISAWHAAFRASPGGHPGAPP
jgi:hypothetical protein